jgi:hypothetical protein
VLGYVSAPQPFELAADTNAVVVAPFGPAAPVPIATVMMPTVVPSVVTPTVASVTPLLEAAVIAVVVVALGTGSSADTESSDRQACGRADHRDLIFYPRPEIGHADAVR